MGRVETTRHSPLSPNLRIACRARQNANRGDVNILVLLFIVTTWTILSLAHLQGTSRKQHSDPDASSILWGLIMISFCSFNSQRTFAIPQMSTHAKYVHVIYRVTHAEPVGQCIIPVFSPSSLIHKVTWCFPSWVTLEVCFILTLYEDMSFFSLQLSGSECPHRGLHSYCVISFGLLFLLYLKRDRVQLKHKCRHLMHRSRL